MSLANIDANLLFPLFVLLEEAHVERAARRLGRSPSATSHMLSRLREALSDPLLVRRGRLFALSPRAEELLPLVRRAVAEVEQVFTPTAVFDPTVLTRTFRIATTDTLDGSVLAPVCSELSLRAPRSSLLLSAIDPSTIDKLRRGELDLAFHSLRQVPAGVSVQPLFRDHFVTVMRKDHPGARGKLTAQRFAGYEHVLVSPAGESRGIVDRLLAEQGLTRHITAVVPSFASALLLVAHTSYITTVPERTARALIGPLNLVVKTPPLALPKPEVLLAWPSLLERDPAHCFLRELVHAHAT